jgi:succinate dehydrogenase / fumarate reductase cytochrome b subunit
MRWLFLFFNTGIGKKLLMSLTGLFLIIFLAVHLAGNLQLLNDDGGKSFNVYARFMTSNPLIKFTSFGLYFFIILHAVVGLGIALTNKKAKGTTYAVQTQNPRTNWASKNMALLGTLIFAFLCIHMGDFWLKMKLGQLAEIPYEGEEGLFRDLYSRTAIAFSDPLIVGVYVVGMIVLAFHLWHGFQSAFQTLGLNHHKYTPAVRFIGSLYAILVPLGFALIPIIFYLTR